MINKNKIIMMLTLFVLSIVGVFAGTISESGGVPVFNGANMCLEGGSYSFGATSFSGDVDFLLNNTLLSMNGITLNSNTETISATNGIFDDIGADTVATYNLDIIPNTENYGLYVDQNNDFTAMFIDSVATTSDNVAVRIQTLPQTTNFLSYHSSNEYVRLLSTNTSSSGTSQFYRNLPSTETSQPVVVITQDNSGDDQWVTRINNDGTGRGLAIDQNGEGIALDIFSGAVTKPDILIDSSKQLNEATLQIQSNVERIGEFSNSLISFNINNAASTGQNLYISSAGSGDKLVIGTSGTGGINAGGHYIEDISNIKFSSGYSNTCDGTSESEMYYNYTAHEAFICDGTSWVQIT